MTINSLQTPLSRVILMGMSIEPCFHDPHTTVSNEDIFLQNFLAIVKQKSSELVENIESMFSLYYMHGYIFSMFTSTTVSYPCLQAEWSFIKLKR